MFMKKPLMGTESDNERAQEVQGNDNGMKNISNSTIEEGEFVSKSD